MEQEPELPLHVKPTVGTAGILTVTVTESETWLPFAPVQVAVYVLFDVRLPVFCEPDVPVQLLGVTVQLAVFADVHVIVVLVLYGMFVLAAEISTVGGMDLFSTQKALLPPLIPLHHH